MKVVHKVCRKTTLAYLVEREVRPALVQHPPKLEYKLQFMLLNKRLHNNINTVVKHSLLPKFRANRTMLHAVVFGPTE